jgi:hypothetical protein
VKTIPEAAVVQPRRGDIFVEAVPISLASSVRSGIETNVGICRLLRGLRFVATGFYKDFAPDV